MPSALRVLLRSRPATVGGAIVLFVLLVGLLAPALAPYDPLAINVPQRLRPPSPEYLFGTDDVGRDVFSRVVFGARVSLAVGGLVVLITGVVGLALGLVSGYYDRVDAVLMRVLDGLMAFPTILLAIALMAALGARLSNVIIALSVVFAPRVARVVRSMVLVTREIDFVAAARALGGADWRVIVRHIMPNCLSPLIVQETFIFAQSVLVEAALSFLGAGVPPYIPSWGNIITSGRTFMQIAPWLTVIPGVALMLTVLGLNLLGDGLRDLADPRLRGRSLGRRPTSRE
ncbi:MAG: ABC transporter permease [Armatimonadetes bacterium]|nr:ABC transporter permease [Armatimonadota bacterium]